jgi:two-component system sensor histidine kinase KdpD
MLLTPVKPRRAWGLAMQQVEHLPSLGAEQESRGRTYAIDSVLAIVGAILVTGVIYAFHLYPKIPTISLVYLLIVLALASTRGRYAAILASIVAFLSFDFFLVPPLYTPVVAKYEDLLALFVFLATAIITGQLASALRLRAKQANRRERETRILYELVHAVNSKEDLEAQLGVIAQAVVDVFSSWGVRNCALLLPDAQGKLTLQSSSAGLIDKVKLSPDEEATAAWVMRQNQTVDLHDTTLNPRTAIGQTPRNIIRSTASSHPLRRYVRMIPLKTGADVVGVMRLLIEDDPRLLLGEATGKSLGVEQERLNPQMAFFWTFLDQAAFVIERVRLRRESLQIQLLQRTDALRTALLSSVSHDLRTPLASIKAAATSLLQEDIQWDDEARRSFIMSIEREVDRLNRLVGNLLDMSRIEGNALKPEKEWYPIDELIHDVLGRMQPLIQGRDVQTHLPGDLPPVELDYLEIDQVLTNLIENAVRYTPEGSSIEISAQVDGEQMGISVADRGPGIPASKMEHIFDKFYRVLDVQRDGTHPIGSGLGLAVSRGLVEAHGGRIWAENREGGGSIFRFTLPLRQAEGIKT